MAHLYENAMKHENINIQGMNLLSHATSYISLSFVHTTAQQRGRVSFIFSIPLIVLESILIL